MEKVVSENLDQGNMPRFFPKVASLEASGGFLWTLFIYVVFYDLHKYAMWKNM